MVAWLSIGVFGVDMCLFGTQLESSSTGERNACEAHAEEVFRRREEKAVQGVGHWIEFKAQENAVSEPFMERQ